MTFFEKGHTLIRIILGGILVANEQTNTPEQAVYTYAYLPPGSYMVQLNADDPIGSMLVTYNVNI